MPDPLQQRCTVNNCSFVKLKVNAGERCNVDNGGCGRFLGPELSNSKTASILHRTQTP